MTSGHLSLFLSLKSYKLTIDWQNIFQQEQNNQTGVKIIRKQW